MIWDITKITNDIYYFRQMAPLIVNEQKQDSLQQRNSQP